MEEIEIQAGNDKRPYKGWRGNMISSPSGEVLTSLKDKKK